MKETYYDRLGVEKTANAQEIKRAYYTLVKQYPPERFPEQYKKLRAAYETLSDQEKRTEYDRIRSLPEDAIFLLEQAEKLNNTGQYAHAADVYNQLRRLYPNLKQATVALARSFESQGKNGKAISLWKELSAQEPENAEYVYELALCYEHRGWHKKADAQYQRALELDSGNPDYWSSLINCRFILRDTPGNVLDICKRGIRTLAEHGKENILLHAYATIFSAQMGGIEESERYLSDIVRIMRTDVVQAEKSGQIIELLLTVARNARQTRFVKYIQEMAETLPSIGVNLREQLSEAARAAEIEVLDEQGFSALFHDLFAIVSNGCDCDQCRLELMSMECCILMELSSLRPQILRIRKEFPNLYALHADFLNEALRAKNAEKMLHQRMKVLNKNERLLNMLEAFDEEDADEVFEPVQPIRRTEPKVGRNDPCPCGSGKKYKKCCGREVAQPQQPSTAV